MDWFCCSGSGVLVAWWSGGGLDLVLGLVLCLGLVLVVCFWWSGCGYVSGDLVLFLVVWWSDSGGPVLVV